MDAGDRIKELRILNNLTLEELGEKVGVKKAAVQKWESGMTKNLKRSTIQKLSEIFDVSPTYVMGMSNVKNPFPYKGLFHFHILDIEDNLYPVNLQILFYSSSILSSLSLLVCF